MPILRQCPAPGCRVLVESGKCPEHRREDSRRRGSPSSRGYGRRWARWRETYIQNEITFPFCPDCGRLFRNSTDIELHHKLKVADRPDLMYDPDNILPLCHRCHSARTARGE